MKLTPSQIPGKLGYRVSFRHPATKKPTSWGLSTTDLSRAERICNEIAEVLTEGIGERDPRLFGYDKRTLELMFGENVANRIEAKTETPILDEDDIGTLSRRIFAVFVARVDDRRKILEKMLRGFESKRYGELQQKFKDIENKVLSMAPKLADTEEELARVKREHNRHVTITVATAFGEFKESGDFKALELKTRNEIDYAVGLFLATLPAKMKLGDIRGTHIQTWVDGLKGKNGGELSPVTKAKMKRYLSVFIKASYVKHDLHENPMEKTTPVKGAALNREQIEAITDYKHFKEMLDTLKDIDAHWHALVATAVLAGPRYAELCWLKLEHVNLKANAIRIATRKDRDTVRGTKTGRERWVPIESKVLLPILREHIKARIAEQTKQNATPAEKSDFVFPSTVAENEWKPRGDDTPVGIWSDSSVFLDTWKIIRARAATVTGERDYWSYGPREWRHCAGTAMGWAGNDTGRVAAWLGNSEDVCKRHYRRPSDKGKLWPLKW